MDKSDVVFLVVTTLIIGFIFGVACTDLTHRADWVYNYQSLIAGILAIVAAYSTVVVMNRAESRQQTRHNQLFAISQRPDVLAAQRAGHLKDYFRILTKNYHEIEDAIAIFASDNAPPITREIVNQVATLVDRIRIGVEMDAIKSAAHLFDAKMSVTYERIKLTLVKFDERLARIRTILDKANSNATTKRRIVADTVKIVSMISGFRDVLNKFADQLEELEKLYG